MFLTGNFISQWKYVNTFFFDNKQELNFTFNVLQKKSDTYVIKELADQLWKTQDEISSLWFVETCSDSKTKDNMLKIIKNNKSSILDAFNNWKSSYTTWNCIVNNIPNPWYNKTLTGTALNDFKNSNLDSNWNFSWTDIKDITQRWYFFNKNNISLSLSWKEFLIATSEKYLYDTGTNVLWLVYNLTWNFNNNLLTWKTYYFNKTNYIPVSLWTSWNFRYLLNKTITYKTNWNIKNSQTLTWIKILTYNNIKNIKNPFLYSIFTNYKPDNWAKNFYYINFTKNEGENNSSTTYSKKIKDKLYIIENKPLIKENNNWLKEISPNTILLSNYFKTNYNLDSVRIKKDIVYWWYYIFWIKWPDKQVFQLKSLSNGVYNINWCVVDNENDSNVLTNNVNLRLAINWNNNIIYKEDSFDTNCLLTNNIWKVYFYSIDLSWNNELSKKIKDEMNFFTKKWNTNLNDYLENDTGYNDKNIILKFTNLSLSNIFFQINKKLNKNNYIAYVYKDNNNIKKISYNSDIQLSNYSPNGDSTFDTTKDNYTKDYYKLSTTIENNNTSNILQLKIKKDKNILYNISYNGFIKNINTHSYSWYDIISLDYDKKDTNNYSSITINFYKNWNLDNSYIISFEKKPYINKTTAIWEWNSWFLNSDWKRYANLTTTDKSNIFTLWLSSFNLFCKKLNYTLTFTSPNISDNLYIYNNKVIWNGNVIKENWMEGWMKVNITNKDVLTYSNEINNINLNNYTDNILKFYIESNNITKDTNLNIKTNIQCDWKNIENKNYTLNIIKNDYNNISTVFYNPIMKNNTILPLLSYFENKDQDTLIYNSAKQKIKYKNVENRLKINYYFPWIKTAWFNVPIN